MEQRVIVLCSIRQTVVLCLMPLVKYNGTSNQDRGATSSLVSRCVLVKNGVALKTTILRSS